MVEFTIQQIERPTTKVAGLWLVKRDGVIVGQLERYKNSRTDTHPWKAYAGTGWSRRFLGAFYEDAEIPSRGDYPRGGRKAALDAIRGTL